MKSLKNLIEEDGHKKDISFEVYDHLITAMEELSAKVERAPIPEPPTDWRAIAMGLDQRLKALEGKATK